MEQIYWVGFNHIKGIGSARIKRLLARFENLEEAWGASLSSLMEAGIPQKTAMAVQHARKKINPQEIWDRITESGIKVFTLIDKTYPKRLMEIDMPPPVLYCRGNILETDQWAVAVVGTRKVTAYGKRASEEVSSYLASNGVTIVSGLARGVDRIAHEASLASGGRTIAVLGCGVDIIYPPEHRQLLEEIIENGAVVSDYSPGTPPEGINFPPRNRIISGLSLASIVIEAGQTSGALITSKYAAEQGREVFALPGYIYAPQSKGTNYLIQEGARPLLSPKDVLDALYLENLHLKKEIQAAIPENDMESQLLKVIGSDTMHIDEIAKKTELAVELISATLVMMELKGLIKNLGSMKYMAVHESLFPYQ